MRSNLEALFAAQLKGAGIAFEREYPFGKFVERKWRADFVARRAPGTDPNEIGRVTGFPTMSGRPMIPMVLVEIQGTGPQGRHGSYGHHHSDCEKFSTAAALGWRVLPLSAKMVKDGSGLALVETALGLKPVPVYVKKARRSKVPKVKRSNGLPERVRKAAGL